MATKADTLRRKLSQSLDRPGPAATPPLLTLPAPDHPKAQGGSDGRQGHKLSVSIFTTDLDKLQAVRRYMLDTTGKLLSMSEAMRLAIRLAPLSPALAAEYDTQQAEDGRRK